MTEHRYLGLAPLRQEGWTTNFNGGHSYPPSVQQIAEMIRSHTRRKAVSEAMRRDAIKIFNLVKQSEDAA